MHFNQCKTSSQVARALPLAAIVLYVMYYVSWHIVKSGAALKWCAARTMFKL